MWPSADSGVRAELVGDTVYPWYETSDGSGPSVTIDIANLRS
jgi:hypothetical protein